MKFIKNKFKLAKIILILYIFLVVFITQFPFKLKSAIDFEGIRYNLIPFNFLLFRYKVLKEVVSSGYNVKNYLISTLKMIIESFGYNIILFIPFGFLMPFIYKQRFTFKKAVISSFLFSFCIEMVQLVIMLIAIAPRCFDVDDILANVIGGSVGYFLYLGIGKLKLLSRASS
jgi:glycopeptide antibiotics resistance protein